MYASLVSQVNFQFPNMFAVGVWANQRNGLVRQRRAAGCRRRRYCPSLLWSSWRLCTIFTRQRMCVSSVISSLSNFLLGCRGIRRTSLPFLVFWFCGTSIKQPTNCSLQLQRAQTQAAGFLARRRSLIMEHNPPSIYSISNGGGAPCCRQNVICGRRDRSRRPNVRKRPIQARSCLAVRKCRSSLHERWQSVDREQ